MYVFLAKAKTKLFFYNEILCFSHKIFVFEEFIIPITRNVSISSETNFYDKNTCNSMGIIKQKRIFQINVYNDL